MYKTFVINLDKDTERLHFMSSQLNELGIEFDRIPAIYGKTYKFKPDEYIQSEAIKRGGNPLLPSELGCALSHISAYKKAKEDNLDFVLILEDDVSLPKNFKEIIEREINKNVGGKKWDYLLFDYVPVGVYFIRQWWSGVRQNYREKNQGLIMKISFIILHLLKAFYIIPLSLFEGFRDKYKKNNPGPVIFLRPVYFAGAYLVSRQGLDKLLLLTKPVVYTADQLPNKARLETNLKFRCYSPLIVAQEKSTFGSSILDLTGEQMRELLNKNI